MVLTGDSGFLLDIISEVKWAPPEMQGYRSPKNSRNTGITSSAVIITYSMHKAIEEEGRTYIARPKEYNR
jgi:hypothetical protein